MTPETITVGELIYEATIYFTNIVVYGVSGGVETNVKLSYTEQKTPSPRLYIVPEIDHQAENLQIDKENEMFTDNTDRHRPGR